MKIKLMEKARFESVDSTKVYINGTIWTYTQPNDKLLNQWVRITFKDGKAYYQEASPEDGKWPEPQIYDFQIEERRYSNNGKKFIGVCWKNDAETDVFTFIPSTHQFKKFSTFGTPIDVFLVDADNGWPD